MVLQHLQRPYSFTTCTKCTTATIEVINSDFFLIKNNNNILCCSGGSTILYARVFKHANSDLVIGIK